MTKPSKSTSDQPTNKQVTKLVIDKDLGKKMKYEIATDPEAAYQAALEKFQRKNDQGSVTGSIMRRLVNTAIQATKANTLSKKELKTVYGKVLSANTSNLTTNEYQKAEAKRQKIDSEFKKRFPPIGYNINRIARNLKTDPATVPIHEYMPFLPFLYNQRKDKKCTVVQAREKLSVFKDAAEKMQYAPEANLTYQSMLTQYVQAFKDIGVRLPEPQPEPVRKSPRIIKKSLN